jgi:Transposase, Mutator family
VGRYCRWLLTELGDIELAVPRTRTFSALKVVRTYARQAKDVDRMILTCFVLGLSTRKVAIALLPVLGRPISPAPVSAVARAIRPARSVAHCLSRGAGAVRAAPRRPPRSALGARRGAHKIARC